jgi:transposase
VFVRRNPGRKGAISIQIVEKVKGRVRVIKTIGTSSDPERIEVFYQRARQEIQRTVGQLALFPSSADHIVESFMSSISNGQVQVVGPELVIGKMFDKVGLNQIQEPLFRHLVLCRIVHPGSKLKTVDYMQRYHSKTISVMQVYRFLDQFSAQSQQKAESIVFDHSQAVVGGGLSTVFYDVTTLFFEASDEDDLRQLGYSKDGKHQNPQILVGMLVGKDGLPLAYEMFKGSQFEGHTFLPVLESFTARLVGIKPVVIADAGLLSNENIKALQAAGYGFILGARLKNEPQAVKTQILGRKPKEGKPKEFKRKDGNRLIVGYSKSRAEKDASNRKRGLSRLEKAVSKGKLTKEHLNKKGYNTYLKMEGEMKVSIDYAAFKRDGEWEGIKGYVTNTKLTRLDVMAQYHHLYHIENAFRMSKTDLKVRPIYHRLESRIKAHLSIAFCSYAVLKELERTLKDWKIELSVKRAVALTQNMYAITFVLPDSKKTITQMLKMEPEQQILTDTFSKF